MSRPAFTAEQRGRASELVRFIFSLPGLRGESPILAEYSIEKFLSGMGTRYAELFSYNGWFEDMDPGSIDRLLLNILHGITDEMVLTVIRVFIEEADFTLFDEFSGGSVANEFRREKIYMFAEALLAQRVTRTRLNSAYTVIRHGMAERYLGEIQRRHQQVYESIAMVNSRTMELPESVLFFKTALILLNGRYMPGGQGCPPSFPDVLDLCPVSRDSGNRPQGELPLPGDFMEILDLRFRNTGYYKEAPGGCISADASWFDVARRTGVAGLNSHLAGILYEIALENNW